MGDDEFNNFGFVKLNSCIPCLDLDLMGGVVSYGLMITKQ